MTHIPFGYRIENGRAVLEEQNAEQVRILFRSYLAGQSMPKAAETAGINRTHSVIKRMLQNRRYLGDAFYPKMIDSETFEKVQEEIQERAKAMNRLNRPHKQKIIHIPTDFIMREVNKNYENPLEQAQYLYSLLEEK